MFNIENKISRWLKDKEPKWLPQISELYIPKIESALLEFDPRWYEKYCEYLNSETAYYDAIRAGESPLAYIGKTYFAASEAHRDHLSYVVDLTRRLTFVYREFLYFVIHEKEVHEEAFAATDRAWLLALTEVCNGSTNMAQHIHADIAAFEAWDSRRLDHDNYVSFLGDRAIREIYILSGCILRYGEPYFSDDIKKVEKEGLRGEVGAEFVWEAIQLEKVLREFESGTQNRQSLSRLDLLTFVYRNNVELAKLVKKAVKKHFKKLAQPGEPKD